MKTQNVYVIKLSTKEMKLVPYILEAKMVRRNRFQMQKNSKKPDN